MGGTAGYQGHAPRSRDAVHLPSLLSKGYIVEALLEHTIPFTGLNDGEHEFHFVLGDDFFSKASDEELEGGNLTVDVTLVKSSNLLVTSMHVEGTVRVECARCAAPLDLPISNDQRQIFQLNADEDPGDDELVGLDAGANSINLSHYLYECIRLALPIRYVHPPGGCDPEVEATLQKLSVDQEHPPDPRWEALNKLKNNRP